MTKVTKNFEFEFPLNHKVVRNLRIRNEYIGSLLVQGTATLHPAASITDPIDERFSADIDFVKWNGADIKDVLQLTSLMEDVQEAALSHASGLEYFSAPLTHDNLLDIFSTNLKDAI